MPTEGNSDPVNILDNNQVSIRFIDQGCGIPKERIPYLGEPFIVLRKRGLA